MGQFGLMSGTTLLKRTFPAAADAKAWGEWNANGRGVYLVVAIDQAEETKAAVRKERREARRRPQCVCAKHQAGIWFCHEHGNVSA